ncbi:MAG: STAS domain-containing protein [Pseudomonadota bacterium]
MELNTIETDAAQVLTPMVDRIDAASAIQFKDAVRAATVEGPDRVVLDLGNVRFVDSSGLGAIVSSMKHLGQGRKMDLAALNPDVDKVFRLTRMDTVFTIYKDIETATDPQTGADAAAGTGHAS